MEEIMKNTICTAVAGLLLLSGLTSDVSAQTEKYTEQSFARLSYITGGTFLQRASDLAYEEGEVNMPIASGDRIGTTDGRAEIYLGNGNYIRLDENTKLDFLRLPAADSPLIQIQIWSGNVYFRVSSLENEKDFEIHTQDVSFYILDIGLYRFDVRPNPETTVLVFKGLLEAAGEDRSVLVKDAQRLTAAEGQLSNSPSLFLAVSEDGFDSWNEGRDSQSVRHLAREYLPEELEDFETELAEHGDWITMAPYGYVWIPSGVSIGWRPYTNGRWLWMPQCGWTWLPYEPWGWAAFHYGRWHWDTGYGWYWIPTTTWGPGWVGWYSGAGYYGWAPLSFYDRPGVIINNVYYPHHTDPYPLSSRALTVIHKNQLQSRNVSRIALSDTTVRSIGKLNLIRRDPEFHPDSSRVSVQQLESGSKVLLHQGDSPMRFQSVRSGIARSGRENPRQIAAPEIRKLRPGTDQADSIRMNRGYPSSSSVTKRDDSLSRTSRSSLGRLYDYISRGSGGRYIKGSDSSQATGRSSVGSSGISSRGSTSRSTISRSPSHSPSRSRASVARSSGGSKTRSSSSSKVKKK